MLYMSRDMKHCVNVINMHDDANVTKCCSRWCGQSVLLWTVTLLLVPSAVWSQTTARSDISTDPATSPQGEGDLRRQASLNLSLYLQDVAVSKHKIAPVTFFPDTGSYQVAVSLSVLIAAVLGVSDAEQTMSTVLTIGVAWQDSAMAWNSSHYSGVQSLELPLGAAWTPVVVLANSFQFNNLILQADHLVVRSDGTVRVDVTTIKETLCPLDLTSYPRDTQQCALYFQTSSSEVSLTLTSYGGVDGGKGSISFENQWQLEGVAAIELPNIERLKAVTLTLSRKSLYYSICLLLPMGLTSYLNTMVFLLPAQSGEKISFLVSIFVSTSVFVSFFQDMLPRGLDTTPATMQLLTGVILENFLVLGLTLLVLRRFHHEQAESHTAHTAHTAHTTQSAEPGKDSAYTSQDTDARNADPHFGEASEASGHQNRSSVRSELSGKFRAFRRKVRPRPGEEEVGGLQRNGSLFLLVVHCKLSAHFLDHVFFVVAFVANSIFLCVCGWDLF